MHIIRGYMNRLFAFSFPNFCNKHNRIFDFSFYLKLHHYFECSFEATIHPNLRVHLPHLHYFHHQMFSFHHPYQFPRHYLHPRQPEMTVQNYKNKMYLEWSTECLRMHPWSNNNYVYLGIFLCKFFQLFLQICFFCRRYHFRFHLKVEWSASSGNFFFDDFTRFFQQL